jgi:hypothetical protein
MRKARRTTYIAVLCISVLAGIGLARKTYFAPNILLVLILTLFLLLKNKKIGYLSIVAVLGLAAGLWRGGQYMSHVRALQSLALQEVTISATATTDSFYGNNSQVQFTGNDIKLILPRVQDLAGSFKLSGFGEQMIYRGDRVMVSGRLYPSRGSNQATIAYAQISRISPGHSWYSDLSRKCAAGMQSALPEPAASFALG